MTTRSRFSVKRSLRDTSDAQDKSLREFKDNPFLDGELLRELDSDGNYTTELTLTNNTPSAFRHNLGREPQGFIVADMNNNLGVATVQISLYRLANQNGEDLMDTVTFRPSFSSGTEIKMKIWVW